MMPQEKLKTTLGAPGHLYLADVHVFGGNSGSPMFVDLGGMRGGSLSLGVDYRLLGIVSGYFFETVDFQLEVATTLSGKANANSGISTVVPVDELKNALGNSLLKTQRDSEARRLGK